MRILFVTDCYPTPEQPQYCIFLEQQAKALQKQGVGVDVYYFKDNEVVTDKDYVIHGIRVFVRKIVSKSKKIDVLFPKRLSSKDESKLYLVLSNEYDCVSFHFGSFSALQSVYAVCKKQGVPLILHFHGLNIWGDYFDSHPLLTKYNNILKSILYSKIDATVNVSGKVKNVFQTRIKGVPSFIVYNGVDVDLFHVDDRSFCREKYEVLCVGNMIPIKGQKYLIDALSGMTINGLKPSLLFAGSGPDEPALEKLCLEKQIDSTFAGYVPYEVISKYMEEKDIFVLPSFYEALGCVYLEAMSAGMITVGVKGQGIDEIIENGINGFLVEPQSSVSISNVLLKIGSMTSEELKQMSMRARETSMRYTWDQSAEELRKVYEYVIEERTHYERL